jgi:hypothetical protein
LWLGFCSLEKIVITGGSARASDSAITNLVNRIPTNANIKSVKTKNSAIALFIIIDQK